MAYKHEIRLCGYGGQGIILAGFMIGQAATIYEHRHATFIQDYGPEARGGACRADVIISDKPVLYPYIDTPSVLVAMSQEAFDKYGTKIGKIVIIDADLVKPAHLLERPPLLMPARRIAMELGKVAVANVVMLGFVTAVTKLLAPESIKESILVSIPKNMSILNTDAFERGYAAGLQTGAQK